MSSDKATKDQDVNRSESDLSEERIMPTPDDPDPHRIYIDEVQGHNKRIRQIINFTHSSTRAAAVMLLAAIVSLVIANTAAYEPFLDFWHMDITIGFGDAVATMSLAHFINDVLMALFFLLVGIEIKYEMRVGELTDIRQAALPVLGALGGVLAPIVIYLAFNASNPDTVHGWGVPTATDIAFALGILALLGNKVPNGIRVFLSTLAVADDIVAIIVIAIFYGETPDVMWLVASAVVFAVLLILNRAHVYSLVPYLALGVVLWFCVYMSGIHSTIAGVLLAFAIPTGSRVNLGNFIKWSGNRVKMADSFYDESTPLLAQEKYITTVTSLANVTRQAVPPVSILERKLYPWVYFLILPLFALTNADVSFIGGDLLSMVTSPIFFGVFFGLLIGKPIGIMLFSFLTIKLKIAKLPEGVTWLHMLGAAILGGVGFTMAIFVANLAYADPAMITDAKLAILSASLLAGICGFTFMMVEAKATSRRGEEFDTPVDLADRQDDEPLDAVDRLDENLVKAEVDIAKEQTQKDIEGMRE